MLNGTFQHTNWWPKSKSEGKKNVQQLTLKGTASSVAVSQVGRASIKPIYRESAKGQRIPRNSGGVLKIERHSNSPLL